jgi:predicted MFS family arabinose efflux permease
VPRLLEQARRGFGLALVGSADNLTLVVMPPITLAILAATSLHGVAFFGLVSVVAGLAILRLIPFGFATSGDETSEGGPADHARRRLGFAFRRTWARLIAIDLLYTVHWGVIVAFLPQRAEAAGADVGLFFVADGIAILLARVPTGWLADRIRPVILVLVGLAAIACAVLVLTLPPTTPLLIVAGTLTGSGGGLVITPLLIELSRRSRSAERGSAFSLFSASSASALAIGSIGGALVIANAGFAAAMLVTFAAIALAAILAALDAGLRREPRNAPATEPAPA